MSSIKISQLIPSAFESWSVILTSLALLVVGDAKVFLQRYDLISSSAVIRDQLSHSVSSGLGKFDSLSFTPGLVTFITWGVIGLATLSVVQAFMRASGVIIYERELSSNEYIHPQNFNRQRYWQRTFVEAGVSFLTLLLLCVGMALYVLYVVPVGLTYTQRFLLHINLANLGALLLGIFTILAGTFVIYYLLKLAAWRHRFSMR